MELNIAGQGTARSVHCNESRGRSRWNRSLDVGVGNNREACRSTVQENAGGSRETLSKNTPALPHFAHGLRQLHERAKPCREAEERGLGRPVKVSVRSLHKISGGSPAIRAVRFSTKVVDRGELARRG